MGAPVVVIAGSASFDVATQSLFHSALLHSCHSSILSLIQPLLQFNRHIVEDNGVNALGGTHIV
jgi:hypothetical protein